MGWGLGAQTVLVDVEEAIKAGADGIVFGCLTPRGEVDVESLEAVLSLCRGHVRPPCFPVPDHVTAFVWSRWMLFPWQWSSPSAGIT